MLMHVNTFLGPTLGKDEQFILNYPTECPVVKKLQETLKGEVDSLMSTLDPDLVQVRIDFFNRIEEWCSDMSTKGIQIDTSLFKKLMQQEITSCNDGDYKKVADLKKLESTILNSVNIDGKLYPTVTASNAITGRITVSNPPVQNLPSSVRKSIVPKASDNHLYYLDYKSMEPCVFAALSKDEFLIEDILSNDFYSVLASGLFNDADESEPSQYRDDIKTLFLATFMYGGDINYNIAKLKLPIQANQWDVLLKKYDVAHAYKSDIIQKKQCRSLIGTPYNFSRAEVNIFNRFIQSEAALIFKEVLLDLSELEQAQNFKMILPIHDAVLIEADSFDTANTVAVEMENSFNQIVDMNIAKVTVQTLTSGGDSDEQQ